MADTYDIEPFIVADTRCPRCGQPTDICVEEVPLILYCEPCNHKWMNLGNLAEGA